MHSGIKQAPRAEAGMRAVPDVKRYRDIRRRWRWFQDRTQDSIQPSEYAGVQWFQGLQLQLGPFLHKAESIGLSSGW